jgi:hypothetical protein
MLARRLYIHETLHLAEQLTQLLDLITVYALSYLSPDPLSYPSGYLHTHPKGLSPPKAPD